MRDDFVLRDPDVRMTTAHACVIGRRSNHLLVVAVNRESAESEPGFPVRETGGAPAHPSR